MKVQRILSGGQTGVDRAALDACLEAGFPCGGWCPAGRKAEDGHISQRYPLQESMSATYDERTRLNVYDSDATLIIFSGELSGGTLLTYNYCRSTNKPVFLFKVSPFFIEETMNQLIHFLNIHSIRILNIAGPRASQWPQAYEAGRLITTQLISQLKASF